MGPAFLGCGVDLKVELSLLASEPAYQGFEEEAWRTHLLGPSAVHRVRVQSVEEALHDSVCQDLAFGSSAFTTVENAVLSFNILLHL